MLNFFLPLITVAGQFVPGVSPSAAGKIAGIEQAGLPVGKGGFSEMDLLIVTIG